MISKKYLAYVFLFSSCAQIVSPGGGPKDELAPIVKNTYPTNKNTEFNKTKIEIQFDEYVEIKEPEQIVISPVIKEKPSIESNGKSIIIDLKKSILEKDKTYTINFGNSITDIHEGKHLDNYSYCFSTGTYIDSLRVEGTIQNAFNLKPEKGLTVGLYPIQNFEDSTPIKNYPEYISQTNEDGKFAIENLPKNSYFLFAFKDENKNLKYEKIESVAFLEKPVETNNGSIKHKLFLSEPYLHTTNKILDTIQREPGVYAFAIYNPKSIVLKEPYYNWQNNDNQLDTLLIYRKERIDSNFTLFNLQIEDKPIQIEVKNRKRLKNKNIEFKLNRDISILDTIKLQSNYPIVGLKAENIKIKKDSTLLPLVLEELNPFNWKINFKKEEGKTYEISIKDSTAYDIWNRPNKEFKTILQVKTSKETGNLILHIDNKNKENYLIQVVSIDEKETVIKEFINTKTEDVQLLYLNPAEIKLKVIQDINKNGKWDRANWIEKSQAEPIAYLNQKISIRAFWDVEQSIDLSKLFDK
ncbi:MAG: Ig-like domain-containing protein [Bacteroidia bacterium]